eukprot:gene3247-4065_t
MEEEKEFNNNNNNNKFFSSNKDDGNEAERNDNTVEPTDLPPTPTQPSIPNIEDLSPITKTETTEDATTTTTTTTTTNTSTFTPTVNNLIKLPSPSATKKLKRDLLVLEDDDDDYDHHVVITSETKGPDINFDQSEIIDLDSIEDEPTLSFSSATTSSFSNRSRSNSSSFNVNSADIVDLTDDDSYQPIPPQQPFVNNNNNQTHPFSPQQLQQPPFQTSPQQRQQRSIYPVIFNIYNNNGRKRKNGNNNNNNNSNSGGGYLSPNDVEFVSSATNRRSLPHRRPISFQYPTNREGNTIILDHNTNSNSNSGGGSGNLMTPQLSTHGFLLPRPFQKPTKDLSLLSNLATMEKLNPMTTTPNEENGGKEKKKSLECPICFEDMTSMSSTTCGHVFCTDCIKKALKKRKQCPVCNVKLSNPKSIHPLFI